MLVEEWMVRPVHTVKPLDSIAQARELMVRHRVNQLPVIHRDELVGIVTDRDLRDAFPSVFEEFEDAIERDERRPRRKRHEPGVDPRQIKVESVMSHQPLVVSPRDRVEDAAKLMRRERIGALPVVEGEKVIGILTRSDVLDAFLGLASSMAETTGA